MEPDSLCLFARARLFAGLGLSGLAQAEWTWLAAVALAQFEGHGREVNDVNRDVSGQFVSQSSKDLCLIASGENEITFSLGQWGDFSQREKTSWASSTFPDSTCCSLWKPNRRGSHSETPLHINLKHHAVLKCEFMQDKHRIRNVYVATMFNKSLKSGWT